MHFKAPKDKGRKAIAELIIQKKPGARLVSLQPQLMAAFNRWRPAIPAGAWRAVHNGKGEWLALLDRERHRVEGDVPSTVLVAGAKAPANQGDWQFRELAA